MLKIDSNQVIKMSRGDDVKFPLFINKGTATAPIRCAFEPNHGCEVYFYIFDYGQVQRHPWDWVDMNGYNPNTSTEYEPILVKVYTDSGTIKTKLYGKDKADVTDVNNINENKDMVIWLFHDDTATIPQGSYIYQIKAKIIDTDFEPEVDPNTGDITYHYVYDTVTNRLPIYIMDDNYGNRVWD